MKKNILNVLLIFLTYSAYSQSPLKTTSINIYKNGNYYIVKEGNIAVKNEYATIEIPKNSLLSTFWISTAKDINISQITYITDTLKKEKPVMSIFELIEANKGKKIKFTYKPAEKELREISGILQDYQKVYGLLKVKTTDNKTMFLYANNILDISFDDSPNEMLLRDSLYRLARIRLDKSISSVPLKVIYMQTGMQWLPSYNIKIVNEKELQLEMKAVVENYAEEVDNAELTLTVGAPQFYFNNTTDPASYDYLSNLYSTPAVPPPPALAVQSYYGNFLYDESASANDVVYEDFSVFETEGEKSNDLYMYKIGKVKLPEKSKTAFQIFSVKLPYKDVYEVNMGDVANYAYYGFMNIDFEKRYDVYHSYLITNSTTYPFTTAPVFVLNEQLQPLAQDQIKYTPVGSNCSVQLSKAGDVVVKYKEEELKKEDAAKRIGKVTYNKVTIKGTISVENLQDKKIELNINKDIIAAVITASDGGKYIKTGRYSNLNPNTKINWTLPLGSKDKKDVSYTYEVFVDASL